MSEYNELADSKLNEWGEHKDNEGTEFAPLTNKYSALPADIQQRIKDQRHGAEWALIKATPDELQAIIRLRAYPHYSTIKWELSAIIERVLHRTVKLGELDDDYIEDYQ